ncbi:MAG: SixA phosphatase family protein [Pikeienuella sp.]|uniref:SixA phosphatase family protein n=1 Tax=Pikeienuella sp. TaxID=2831957 RepID=UPI00391C3068
MTLRLILLRHAKSDWHAGLSDHERPLNRRGRLAAPLMGAWLREEGLTPALALVSSATRTQETWERLGLAAPMETRPAIYEAEAETILEELNLTGGAASPLLLVGHNPGIGDAANRLLSDDVIGDFPTAQAAVIGFEAAVWADVRPGCGRLLALAQPKGLV